MTHNICIIGCGWLGLPLAKHLIKKGFEVHGTTTSAEKTATLENAAIAPFVITLTSEGVTGPIRECLAGCRTLVLNIPPGLRKNPNSNYVAKMRHLLSYLESSSVEQLIFISSTSVYEDQPTFPLTTENTAKAHSESARQLLEAEALFNNSSAFKTVVLRFGGLFSDDRHPAQYLSGRQQVSNPEAPVNLIHRDDCVAIIHRLIVGAIWNTTLNAVTGPHPTKKAYYTSVCRSLKIPIPQFDATATSQGKLVDASTLVQLLNYDFKVKLNN